MNLWKTTLIANYCWIFSNNRKFSIEKNTGKNQFNNYNNGLFVLEV